jgi:hypothetical protein
MKALSVLLVLFAFGCLGTAYTVHPDLGFAPSVLDAAHAAAADWEANVLVKITFSNEMCPVLRRMGMICMHPVQSIPTLPWEPGVLAGFTVYYDIWLAEPLLESGAQKYKQRVIAHEMGHSMGLSHTGPGTLMYPYSNGGSWTVTAADATQWRVVRGLK